MLAISAHDYRSGVCKALECDLDRTTSLQVSRSRKSTLKKNEICVLMAILGCTVTLNIPNVDSKIFIRNRAGFLFIY